MGLDLLFYLSSVSDKAIPRVFLGLVDATQVGGCTIGATHPTHVCGISGLEGRGSWAANKLSQVQY